MFIAEDEHVILFDYVDIGPQDFFYNPLTADEIVRFAEAGVRTIHRNVQWRDVERSPGQFDWTGVENWLAMVRAAGLKALLNVGLGAPDFYPPDWYCRNPDGKIVCEGWFSPWCAPAQARLEEWYTMCRQVLNADDVLCIKSGANGGEMLLDTRPAYYDPHALTDFKAKFGGVPEVIPTCNPVPETPTLQWLRYTLVDQALRQQEILALNQHNEIWSHLHMCFQDGPMTGNGFAHELYAAYRQFLPTGSFQGICYGYFWVSDLVRWRQHDLAASCGQQLWVGSERCEGLVVNTAAGIAAGVRGFVTGPMCKDRAYHPVRPGAEQYQAVRDSLRKWQAVRA